MPFVFSWRLRSFGGLHSTRYIQGFSFLSPFPVSAYRTGKAMEDVGMANQYCSSGTAQELHVLAVDDSLVDRKVIERLLKISCCKVTAVESGRRALQYLGLDGDKNAVGFDGLKVNLILTDYSMPGMTGYELLKKIKGSSALNKIPVVIMSSENILARIDRCLEEGAEEFLVKPVKLSDVKRIKDFVLKGGDENGKKQNLEARGEEKIMHKETRKRCIFDDEPLSPDQLLSSPSSPLACFSPLELTKLDTELDNASSPKLLTTSATTESKEPQLKRPRINNPTDS